MENYKKRKDNIINYEIMSGWPIHRMTVRDILIELGATLENGKWVINDNNEILDIYPRTLEDDGMGYGVNEKYIIEVTNVNKDNVNIFICEEYDENQVTPGDIMFNNSDDTYWVVTDEIDEDKVNCIAFDAENDEMQLETRKWIKLDNLSHID